MCPVFQRFCGVWLGLVLCGACLAVVVHALTARSAHRGPADVGIRLFPRRSHYLAFAVAFTLFAIYGSLVPLHYTPLTWAAGIEQFRQIPFLDLRVQGRTDWAANILLFIPIGFFWLAALLIDRPRLGPGFVAAPLVIASCAALSLSLEFSQIWFPPRTATQNDVLAQILGDIWGVMLWLTLGGTLTAWLRNYPRLAARSSWLQWLLQAYFLGLLIYSLLPLDLTLSPVELVRKYRQGRIELIPFSEGLRTVHDVGSLVIDALLWVPVGALCALGFSQQRDAPRSVGSSLLLGTMLVAAVEAMQLLVFSRYSSTTDILVGAVGVALGAGMVHWMWSQRVFTSESRVRVALRTRAAPWLLLASLHTFALLTVYCTPLEFVGSGVLLRQRASSLWRPPFSAMYWGTEFNAATVLLRNILWFVPLGVFLGRAARLAAVAKDGPRQQRRYALLFLGCVLGLALAIEAFQVCLVSRVPDLTDVVLYLCGAGLGFVLSAQWDKLGVHPAGRVGHPHDLPLSCAEGERPVAEISLRNVSLLAVATLLVGAAAVGIPLWLSRL